MLPYFRLKYQTRGTDMHFCSLLEALLDSLRVRIRNGHLTERGLARRTGLSQSHIHNVLSGARFLTPQTADAILKALGLSVWDVMAEEPPARKPPPPRSGTRPAPRKRSAAS